MLVYGGFMQTLQEIQEGVLDAIGNQLLPRYAVAEYGDDLDAALQPVERALLRPLGGAPTPEASLGFVRALGAGGRASGT